MKLIIGIDDTDNLTSKGTGTIASEIRKIIVNNNWGAVDFITRHQLYLHEEIQYTSHNSSMIFKAEIDEMYYDELKNALTNHVREESAEGSDPAICIVNEDMLKENETAKNEIVHFGYLAKCTVLTQKAAYDLAEKNDIYLQALGGTGDGVIGALAGCGLRFAGNDGEVKGGLDTYKKGEVYAVSDFLQEKCIDVVVDTHKNNVPPTEQVKVKWKVKPVLQDGVFSLVLEKNADDNLWYVMDKEGMRAYGSQRCRIDPCVEFQYDVVEERVLNDDKSCLNCRFRRFTSDSFTCMKHIR